MHTPSTVDIPKDAAVFITGHRGMVGSALQRRFAREGFNNLMTTTRQELDLRDQQAVSRWFAEHRPLYVVHAAGLVGGIIANSRRPAEFLYDNLMMQATVMHAAWEYDVKKLLYLGSSCVYPRDCPQPIKEEYLLSGPLETTNYGYSIAKIAGIKSCEAFRQQYGSNFISCMPPNLFGPGDNFELESSHVLPALIRKFDDARRDRTRAVTIWGSGTPRREFLFVDELADACLFLLRNYNEAQTINVGSGEEVTISELAELIRDIVYPDAQIEFDRTKPDGTPRKLLDSQRLLALGWRPSTSLAEGLKTTYQWYLDHRDPTPSMSLEQVRV